MNLVIFDNKSFISVFFYNKFREKIILNSIISNAENGFV